MNKFNIIYMDPPWKYSDRAGKRGADKKYSVMSTRDLSLLRIRDIADDNCACFMWATGPMMPDALRLIGAYGFEYKNIVFTWIKQNKNSETIFKGMGHYSRSNAEYVLLGMKGKLERKSKSVGSVIISKRCEHSSKPKEVRKRIVELFGDIPRVELFARDKSVGWEQTGLEFDGLDVSDFIENKRPIKNRLVEIISNFNS